jgi:hypothetical protein
MPLRIATGIVAGLSLAAAQAPDQSLGAVTASGIADAMNAIDARSLSWIVGTVSTLGAAVALLDSYLLRRKQRREEATRAAEGGPGAW